MAAHGWRLLWSSNSNCFGDDVSWSERDLWAKDVEMLEVGSPGREVVGGASGERRQEFCNSVLIHRDWSIENAHVDGLNRARCSRRAGATVCTTCPPGSVMYTVTTSGCILKNQDRINNCMQAE
mgnify:CR=1 FL=1